MLKILEVRLQQYMNCELTDVQAGLRKQTYDYRREWDGEAEGKINLK